MWINRKLFNSILEAANRENTALKTKIAALELDVRRANVILAQTRAVTTEARIKAATAQAYMDSWRLELNTVREERASLLVKLIPDLKIAVPRVEHATVAPPGANFEDMGDAAAHVYADANEVPEAPLGIVREPGDIPGDPASVQFEDLGDEHLQAGTVVKSRKE